MKKTCEYQALFWFMLICFLATAAACGWAIDSRDAWRDAYEHAPIYHCDGVREKGYANPGTPDARGCWMEVGK